MIKEAHKIGAGLYVIWGLLHLKAAYDVSVLAGMIPTEFALAQGRVFQDAWNLAFLGLFAIVIALTLNWKNNALGYWLNLAVVSITDIGFLLFLVGPGLIPFFPGIAGPVVWILALTFSTVGFRLAARSRSIF